MTTDLILPDPNRYDWRVPATHYSDVQGEAVFFYGGPFSNFVGPPMLIPSLQPWSAGQQVLLEYYSVEHFFQASKATTEADHMKVVWAEGPWQAKSAGRSIKLRDDWEEVKLFAMLRGLRAKFKLEPYRTALIQTGTRYIAEDSPTDDIWGIRSGKGSYGGHNYLGLCLIIVRAEIRTGKPWHRIRPSQRI